MKFEANTNSLAQHEVPDWFHDAKLGIFIHWGLFSVPAYSPIEFGDINDTFAKGPKFHFEHNPYAEWYQYTLNLQNSQCRKYHNEKYGENFPYDNFIPKFNEEIKKWNPDDMVDVFKKIGAQYVVLTTKHIDGFLLWPSEHSNPMRKGKYYASRDIVGELTEAVKSHDMKMGFYYSSLMDWTFDPSPIDSIISMLNNGSTDPEYARYVDKHWYELIDKYKPSILWSDIGYPVKGKSEEIIAYFYNKIREGVVNDRWKKTPTLFKKIIKFWPINKIVERIGARMIASEGVSADIPSKGHCDFKTPEYASFKEIKMKKWESCRGIGRSFGYNMMEEDEHHISITDLIHSFIDIVSKNGNLLLNVGPKADGTIPKLQMKRLLGLGKWLAVNGEAIFGSRPWNRAEGTTTGGIPVRFTKKDDIVFALLLGKPKLNTIEITIENLEITDGSSIELLGVSKELSWKQESNKVTITLPEGIRKTEAIVFKINFS